MFTASFVRVLIAVGIAAVFANCLPHSDFRFTDTNSDKASAPIRLWKCVWQLLNNICGYYYFIRTISLGLATLKIYACYAVHVRGINSNSKWHHMAYTQFVIINMLLGILNVASVSAFSCSILYPTSLYSVHLSYILSTCQTIYYACPAVPGHDKPYAKPYPSHHIMIYSCPPGLSCRLHLVFLFFMFILFFFVLCFSKI